MDNRSQTSRQTLANTQCCMCGIPIVANMVSTCGKCLQSRHDITEVLEKQIIIVQCKRCDKWQKEDATYTRADMESKELLAFCLRKMRNLRSLKLIDASFMWTEPHSKRIKVKLKLQKEVERSVILQQTCVIEFIVQNKMCLDCHRSEASLTWESVVQLRQTVDHKRTFLYLEQLILKHRAQEKAVKIEPQPEGVDFFFYSKTDGARFVSFLDTMVPIKFKMSEKLITADLKSNNATYTFSYCVEIAPICKDDLIILPKPIAAQLGSMPRICVCLNVASVVRLIDPFSGRFCELAGNTYWLNPFKSILTAKRLVLFMVMDVLDLEEPAGVTVVGGDDDEEEAEDDESQAMEEQEGSVVSSFSQNKKRRRKAKAKKFSASARLSSKHRMCEVVVAKESDLGRNDKQYMVKSHLGYVLKPGDYVLGYDVTTCNVNHDENDRIELPDIVLIKKHFVRNDKMERNWKLKSITREAPNAPGLGVGVRDMQGGDMEMFMRDLEEDTEMRAKVNVFKRTSVAKKTFAAEEHDAPEIPQDEMLDDAQKTEVEDNDEDDDEEEGDDDDDDEDDDL